MLLGDKSQASSCLPEMDAPGRGDPPRIVDVRAVGPTCASPRGFGD
jgi:hypothetical protein